MKADVNKLEGKLAEMTEENNKLVEASTWLDTEVDRLGGVAEDNKILNKDITGLKEEVNKITLQNNKYVEDSKKREAELDVLCGEVNRMTRKGQI